MIASNSLQNRCQKNKSPTNHIVAKTTPAQKTGILSPSSDRLPASNGKQLIQHEISCRQFTKARQPGTLPNTTAVGCHIQSELNLGGSFVDGCAGHNFSHAYTDPGMLDGIFPISFSFDDASPLITPFTVVGVNSDGFRTAPLVLLDINRVPEPASLLLVGLGLLGLGLSRRNRHQ